MIQSAIERVRGTAARAERRRTTSAVILAYHGVADVPVDPWALFVTPERFDRQMEVLRTRFQPTSLRALADACATATIREHSVVVTFDDGYANNLHTASPILEKHGVPSTVFAVSEASGSGREFWWDELEQILLRPGSLPTDLTLCIGGRMLSWSLGPAANYTDEAFDDDRRLSASGAATGTRLAFFHGVWRELQSMSEEDRRNALQQLAIWTGREISTRSTHRPMTREELIELDRRSLIEIGSHSRAHTLLPAEPRSRQRFEIEESASELERLLDHPVASFCYPFGGHTDETVDLVRNAGFACACSCIEEPAWHRSDVLRLPRFMVHDWEGDEFARRLEKWFRS